MPSTVGFWFLWGFGKGKQQQVTATLVVIPSLLVLPARLFFFLCLEAGSHHV